jgi:hypothetical protein
MVFETVIALAISIIFGYVAGRCIPRKRKFADSLYVNCTTSGTQYINLIELISKEEATRDSQNCSCIFDSYHNQTPKKELLQGTRESTLQDETSELTSSAGLAPKGTMKEGKKDE